jgi:hypothetical protein
MLLAERGVGGRGEMFSGYLHAIAGLGREERGGVGGVCMQLGALGWLCPLPTHPVGRLPLCCSLC